jgi:hypothetical protein
MFSQWLRKTAPFGSLQMTLFQPIKIGSGRSGYEAIRIMHIKWGAWCQLDKAPTAYGVACREGVWRLSGVCPQGGTTRASDPGQTSCKVHRSSEYSNYMYNNNNKRKVVIIILYQELQKRQLLELGRGGP